MLTAEHIRVRYRDGALGASDVSVSVDAGQIVAILGPNGAGKSTTVRAMSGFLRSEGARVESGTITIDGTDVRNAEPHRCHRLGIVLVPERRKVFPNLTVRENLSSLRHRGSRADQAAATDWVFELFPILQERSKQLAGRLSGGQQQMLAIGRSLVSLPKYLLVDELTLGLHTSLHPVLLAAVQEIARTGTAVVLVDESTALALDVADRCYLLQAGRVLHAGPAAELRESDLLAAGYVAAET